MEEIIEEVKTQEEIIQELDDLNRLAIDEANKPKILSAEEKIIQRLARLQRIYIKQSVRITAIQINQEGSTDSEYIKTQLSNYELRYSLAKYTLNDVNATEEDKLIANAVIQASESASIYVSYARLVLDVIRRDLTIAINDGIDIDKKLDILDNLVLVKDGITKEKIDLFLANFNVPREIA